MIVEELVREHEGGDKQTKLATILTTEPGVLGLESVDVEEGENDDRLGDLGCCEHVANKVDESSSREQAEETRVVGAFGSRGSGASGLDSGAGMSLDGVVEVANGEGDGFRETAKAELLECRLGAEGEDAMGELVTERRLG